MRTYLNLFDAINLLCLWDIPDDPARTAPPDEVRDMTDLEWERREQEADMDPGKF